MQEITERSVRGCVFGCTLCYSNIFNFIFISLLYEVNI